MYMYVALSLASWPRVVCLGYVSFDLFPQMGHGEVDLFRRQILPAFPPIIDATLAAQASSPSDNGRCSRCVGHVRVYSTTSTPVSLGFYSHGRTRCPGVTPRNERVTDDSRWVIPNSSRTDGQMKRMADGRRVRSLMLDHDGTGPPGNSRYNFLRRFGHCYFLLPCSGSFPFSPLMREARGPRLYDKRVSVHSLPRLTLFSFPVSKR